MRFIDTGSRAKLVSNPSANESVFTKLHKRNGAPQSISDTLSQNQMVIPRGSQKFNNTEKVGMCTIPSHGN